MWQRWWKICIHAVARRTVLLPFFVILRFVEWAYSGIFRVVHIWRKKHGGYRIPARVVSIGNISAGGVGKSLLVAWLARELKQSQQSVAIFLRGYKSACERIGGNYCVQHNSYTMADVAFAGDEAYMLRSTGATIVVGASRLCSWRLLQKIHHVYLSKIDYVLLDDAYQNMALRKDVEVVLLDARNPFDNGHCFPLGELREKDLSRADAVVLTHAASIDEHEKQRVTDMVRRQFTSGPIMYGCHKPLGVYRDDVPIVPSQYKQYRFVACAGIGSFSGFESVLNQLSVLVAESISFPDHHAYTKSDVARIKKICDQLGVGRIITTDKDRHKLTEAFRQWGRDMPLIYCARIQFAFEHQKDQDTFMQLIR